MKTASATKSQAKPPVQIDPRWLSRKLAAQYLNISVVCFDENVRPNVPESRGAGDPRWSIQDLDDFMASRKISLDDPFEDD